LRAVVQRVTSSSVEVEGEIVGKINRGLLVLLGIGEEDSQKDLDYISDKVAGLRIFEDANDKMNLSVKDIRGEILVISQFTLYGDARKGKRPSFSSSAKPDIAEKLYKEFIQRVKDFGIHTQEGIFGAHMKVSLVNDGPVTILLDSKKTF
jgi:D-aminoacyl-tRNA deacylase